MSHLLQKETPGTELSAPKAVASSSPWLSTFSYLSASLVWSWEPFEPLSLPCPSAVAAPEFCSSAFSISPCFHPPVTLQPVLLFLFFLSVFPAGSGGVCFATVFGKWRGGAMWRLQMCSIGGEEGRDCEGFHRSLKFVRLLQAVIASPPDVPIDLWICSFASRWWMFWN